VHQGLRGPAEGLLLLSAGDKLRLLWRGLLLLLLLGLLLLPSGLALRCAGLLPLLRERLLLRLLLGLRLCCLPPAAPSCLTRM